MARKKYEYLGGRTVTVTCLGTMTNEEAIDFLAEQIAHIYHKKYENKKVKQITFKKCLKENRKENQ